LIVVAVLAIMYGADSDDMELPEFLTIGSASVSEEVHLGMTVVGLSFAGSLALLVVLLGLLVVSAWILIIFAQLLLFLTLVGTGIASLQYAQQPISEVCAQGICHELPDYSSWAYLLAVISFALAGLLLLWLCCIRERIQFTAMVLSSVGKVLLQLPELLIVQFGAAIIALLYSVLWIFAYFELNHLVAHLEWYSIGAINVLSIFSLFWGQLVITNISLVTTCGAIGGWYYSHGEAISTGCFLCRPAVCTPLIRACTLSLGSIALGSLLVAVVRTIIVVVKSCAESAGNSNGVLKLACCCCVCLLGCLERCIEWLTDYAFVYVAIYGTSFMTAGASVVSLLAKSGVGAIAQQTLITPVLNLAALCGALLGGYLGYLAQGVTGISAQALAESSGLEGNSASYGGLGVCVVLGAAVGWFLTGVGLSPIDAGAKALFVCYAESPEGMVDKSPELHTKLAEGAPLKKSNADQLLQP